MSVNILLKFLSIEVPAHAHMQDGHVAESIMHSLSSLHHPFVWGVAAIVGGAYLLKRRGGNQFKASEKD